MSKLTSWLRRRHRRRLLLAGFDPSVCVGLEIGPSDKPVIRKNEGRIFYADIASAGYPVDFIWDGKPLRDTIPADISFDYVIASHVIEHTGDMIGWMKEVATVIKPGGVLSLAVPDKRFTLDRDREVTTLEQLVRSHAERGNVHSDTPGAHNHVFTCDTFRAIIAALCSDSSIPFRVHAFHSRPDSFEFICILQTLNT